MLSIPYTKHFYKAKGTARKIFCCRTHMQVKKLTAPNDEIVPCRPGYTGVRPNMLQWCEDLKTNQWLACQGRDTQMFESLRPKSLGAANVTEIALSVRKWFQTQEILGSQFWAILSDVCPRKDQDRSRLYNIMVENLTFFFGFILRPFQ